jgi:hypothetical protein
MELGADAMQFIKIDDPRLDENYSFFFTYKRGEQVKGKNNRALTGEISDGVYVGEFPAHVAAADDAYRKGRTLYEIKMRESEVFVVADNEIEKA